MVHRYFTSLQNAIAQNDGAIFFNIVNDHLGKRILATAKGLLGENGGIIDEKDILQYVLTKAYQKGIRYFKDYDQGRFEGYLLLATRHKCLNVLRDKNKLPTISMDINEHHSNPMYSYAEELKVEDELENKLKVLTDIQKIIIIRYLQGYNFNEIASELHKKPSTIQYHKKMALERMDISSKAF